MALTQVSTDGVKNDAITKTKIPANQIEASELADNAVDTNAIADDAITTDKVGDNAITQAKLNFPVANRNLIINGAMQVAQRGTSSTSNGMHTVDRFQVNNSATDEAPTQAQVDVASGTTPYSLGFRKALKVTNGNQTSGAGTSDFIRALYYIEAQDLANSGWNYKSSSSYITLSFWVKASVAQTYYTNLRSFDGTQKMYYFSYTLSANTWTKVTHTISGHADISFDNDNGQGMYIQWYQYRGTDNTGTVTADQWHNLDTSTFTPDQDSTWYTTNDATWEMTGVQLEVGSIATDFEHRSFAQELTLCQRYFQSISRSSSTNSVDGTFAAGTCNTNAGNGGILQVMVRFQTTMRAAPTMTQSGTFSHHVSGVNVADTTLSFNQAYIDGIKCTGTQTAFVSASGSCGELTSKYSDTSTATIKADAEL